MSCLVAASTPRVTSNSSRTRASVSSHRAITTFCWLPPDSVPTAWLVERPRADPQLVDDRRDGRPFRAAPDEPGHGPARQRGQRDVVANRTVAGTGPRPCGPRARRRCRCRPGSRPCADADGDRLAADARSSPAGRALARRTGSGTGPAGPDRRARRRRGSRPGAGRTRPRCSRPPRSRVTRSALSPIGIAVTSG